MSNSNDPELDRMWRVLRQTLDLHAQCRSTALFWAMFLEVAMLMCSVIFCATAFSGDEIFKFLRIDPESGRMILKLVSVVCFAASVTLIKIDLRGKAARHGDSINAWSAALEAFRSAWSDKGWRLDAREGLCRAYWDAEKRSAALPQGRKFIALKSRHLLNVEISKRANQYPGCPRLLLWAIVRMSGSWYAIKESVRKSESKVEAEKKDGQGNAS